MRIQAIGQTGNFAAPASSIPKRQSAARAVQSISAADILVPALWSGIGLILSALFLPLLSNVMAAGDDTFSFLGHAFWADTM